MEPQLPTAYAAVHKRRTRALGPSSRLPVEEHPAGETWTRSYQAEPSLPAGTRSNREATPAGALSSSSKAVRSPLW